MALVVLYVKIVLVQYIVKMAACVRCLGISANVELVSMDQGATKGNIVLTFFKFCIEFTIPGIHHQKPFKFVTEIGTYLGIKL